MGGTRWAAPGEPSDDDGGAVRPSGPPVRPPVAAPVPPPPPQRKSPPPSQAVARLRVAVAVALVALVLGGFALATGGGDESDEPDEAADAVEPHDRSGTAGPSAASASSTTTMGPTTTTEPPWQTVTGADGAFQVGLPADWHAITVAGDMTGRGDEMFSDDLERAELAELALTILPTPQTRFLAMDGDSLPSIEETDVLIVESGPASVGQQAAYDLAKQFTEVPILQEGTATTPVGVVGWFEISPDVAEMVARKYVVVHEGTGWVLTYWSGDIAGSSGRADRIVGSFTPD